MKKIYFNDKYGLTQAVLDGRKTMTRRMIKPKYGCSIEKIIIGSRNVYYFKNSNINEHGIISGVPVSNFDGFVLEKAPYQVGEIVAIAQNYKDANVTLLDYLKATNNKGKGYDKGCSNKEFVKAELMPHQIKITDIHIERLQDISDADCIKEGVSTAETPDGLLYYTDASSQAYSTPQQAFAILIDKVGSRGTWESNPYVAVYSFILAD